VLENFNNILQYHSNLFRISQVVRCRRADIVTGLIGIFLQLFILKMPKTAGKKRTENVRLCSDIFRLPDYNSAGMAGKSGTFSSISCMTAALV
jgi:hypothetical protein